MGGSFPLLALLFLYVMNSGKQAKNITAGCRNSQLVCRKMTSNGKDNERSKKPYFS